MNKQKTNLEERIILVDARQIDTTAGELRSYFQTRLQHAIPQADLAEWLICDTLDAGWEAKEKAIRVVFVRQKGMSELTNFLPANLDGQIDGMAFQDNASNEFLLSVVTEEEVNSGEPLFVQCVRALTQDATRHRLILAPDMARYGAELLDVLAQDTNCDTTLLTMQPIQGKGFTHQVSGFGLIHAMGIDPAELE